MTRLYTFLASLAGVGAFIAAIWAKAQASQRKDTAAEATEARLEARIEAQELTHEIENLDAAERARRLDGLWSDTDD